MSGLEVAGLILPLLLSAFEHWDACAKPFARYKKFKREAMDYIDSIEIERAIFDNECRCLLGNIVEPTTVSGMLESLAHSNWHSEHVDGELAKYLGDSLRGCLSIVNLINQQLQELGEDSLELSEMLQQEHEVRDNRPSSVTHIDMERPEHAKVIERQRMATQSSQKAYFQLF